MGRDREDESPAVCIIGQDAPVAKEGVSLEIVEVETISPGQPQGCRGDNDQRHSRQDGQHDALIAR